MNDFFEECRLREVGNDIFYTPFLTTAATELLLNICKNFTDWKPNTDRYATQDLVFKDQYYAYHEIISSAFNQLKSNIEKMGWHTDDFDVTEIFAVKYSLDTQRSLKLHVDDSYITGSIKLNSEYTGGVLSFPRQDFDNTGVPVGGLLIWPSQITHPHLSSKIESGEKYSITIWTGSKKSS